MGRKRKNPYLTIWHYFFLEAFSHISLIKGAINFAYLCYSRLWLFLVIGFYVKDKAYYYTSHKFFVFFPPFSIIFCYKIHILTMVSVTLYCHLLSDGISYYCKDTKAPLPKSLPSMLEPFGELTQLVKPWQSEWVFTYVADLSSSKLFLLQTGFVFISKL